MNKIPAKIINITTSGGIALVDLETGGCSLSALIVDAEELPVWLSPGADVLAVFKESELSIAVRLSGKISLRNRFPCKVTNINLGELLSVVELRFGSFTIHSAITTRSVKSLELEIGTEVTALIKANEISLIKQTESGKRKAENGKRKTESGKRKAESGKRKTESGKRKAEDGRKGGRVTR
ncbi:TOBE domain-containing protein [Alkalitalea saponilacus]|uniref:TOBE domain-containing protein n=1 Tax=Alkalitalea saponilacus TaxID=889453 RepID=A0A1T5GNP8_9BACT|nr:TOBE domain-containing protein [Alkalitalea saponilacus]ASB48249.1 hypothetical protein CDL62_03380 [Alkalitalea saponilacus]SKC10033.1 TOBE domain-containing protein [Alkalitalea saponilacus]